MSRVLVVSMMTSSQALMLIQLLALSQIKYCNTPRNPPYLPPYNVQRNPNFYAENFNHPNDSPTTNHNLKIPNVFKIYSKAAEAKCLTLRIIKSNLASESSIEKKVDLKSFQSNFSPKQGWKINSETSYIHSVHDKSLCLLPKFESQDSVVTNEKRKRTRLTVGTCPYVRAKKFQWRITSRGLIVNKKKDADGTPLIRSVNGVSDSYEFFRLIVRRLIYSATYKS